MLRRMFITGTSRNDYYLVREIYAPLVVNKKARSSGLMKGINFFYYNTLEEVYSWQIS